VGNRGGKLQLPSGLEGKWGEATVLGGAVPEREGGTVPR
jgi:hypothetical protein